jgi:hypothetical protein
MRAMKRSERQSGLPRPGTRHMRTKLLAGCFLLFLALASGDAAANAPPGRYTISQELVRDNGTNLTWQRRLDAATRTQAQAASYCAALTLAGGGFRLPTAFELRSIIDVTRVNAAIDPEAFPETPSAWFWTSTPYVAPDGDGINRIWYVDFGDGGAYGEPAQNPHRVRCVR